MNCWYLPETLINIAIDGPFHLYRPVQINELNGTLWKKYSQLYTGALQIALALPVQALVLNFPDMRITPQFSSPPKLSGSDCQLLKMKVEKKQCIFPYLH